MKNFQFFALNELSGTQRWCLQVFRSKAIFIALLQLTRLHRNHLWIWNKFWCKQRNVFIKNRLNESFSTKRICYSKWVGGTGNGSCLIKQRINLCSNNFVETEKNHFKIICLLANKHSYTSNGCYSNWYYLNIRESRNWMILWKQTQNRARAWATCNLQTKISMHK